MYLQPWQIFLGGCLCGMCITVIVLVAVFIRLATFHGVVVKHGEDEKEKEDNE